MKCEKSKKIIACLFNLFEKKLSFLEKYIKPILLLSLRILIASVFLKSGLTKIANFNSTIYLFEYDYQVPLLSPVLAAYLATIFEIGCSVFLIIGFATRLACLPLIGMSLIIQFSVIQNPQHYYWIAILSTITILGAGFISIDCFLKKSIKNCLDK